ALKFVVVVLEVVALLLRHIEAWEVDDESFAGAEQLHEGLEAVAIGPARPFAGLAVLAGHEVGPVIVEGQGLPVACRQENVERLARGDAGIEEELRRPHGTHSGPGRLEDGPEVVEGVAHPQFWWRSGVLHAWNLRVGVCAQYTATDANKGPSSSRSPC